MQEALIQLRALRLATTPAVAAEQAFDQRPRLLWRQNRLDHLVFCEPQEGWVSPTKYRRRGCLEQRRSPRQRREEGAFEIIPPSIQHARQHKWKVAGCRPEKNTDGVPRPPIPPHQCSRAGYRLLKGRGISTGQSSAGPAACRH